ncbi:MAG TPA: RNA polymerase sigma factor, partial [bacterium]|nr:RNA polymerase sigma factor [bacterium]
AMAVRLCGSRTAAEDLVQEALLRAFRGFPRLRNRAQPRVWLTKVLTSAFQDRLRQKRREPEAAEVDEEFDLFDRITEEDPFPYSNRLHLDFLELFDDERLLDVLQRLSPHYRVALILAYVYGYPAREIGAMTGRPLGTILAWLHRARRQLERELWEYAVGRRLLTSVAKETTT